MEQLRAVHRANKKECLSKFNAGTLTDKELEFMLNRAYHAGRNVGRKEVETENLFRAAGYKMLNERELTVK